MHAMRKVSEEKTMKQDMIVILDLGSTENTVLARQIRALGVYSEIHPHDITVEELKPHYDDEFEQAVIKSVLTAKLMRLIGDAADIAVV